MRREDHGLLTGATAFTADIAPNGALALVFVRSTVAHGVLKGLELSAARALDGVLAVYDAADLRALGAQPMPCGIVTPGQRMTALPLLASDRVTYVGQPLAVVAAVDEYVACDGAALVQVEVEPLPVVMGMEAALAPDAPLLHPEWGTNVLAESVVSGGVLDDAVAAAVVSVCSTLRVQRQAPASMEGRACAADLGGDGRVTAWVSTQSAHQAKMMIAAACGWPAERLRVICPAVGGSFGLKEYAYPEEAVSCLVAADLGRPVCWAEDRRENLTSACHARESVIELELHASSDGRVLAVEGKWLWDVGGHPSAHGLGPAQWGATMLTGPYRVAATRIAVTGVVTNKAPIGGYRGYGGPQAHLAMERALDVLASELGLGGEEIRRRNLLSADELPTAMPTGVPIDSGDHLAAFEEMVVMARAAALETAPVFPGGAIGVGVAPYAMSSGVGPSEVAVAAGMEPSFETVRLAVDEDGCAVVHVPTSAQGQGHLTLLADVAAGALGWPGERVRVIAGDSDLTPYSPLSAVGSRTAVVVASVVRRAALELGASLERVPRADWPGRSVEATLDPPGAPMTYGAHAAVVEVDPALGTVAVRRYLALDDCGPRLQPEIVEGQLRGGIAQGIGSALLEELRFDADGTPLSGSFSDYLLPTAAVVPHIDFIVRETPGGVKGVGEAGVFGPAATIAQAVDDALGRRGRRSLELPLTPERVLA
jgi:aerobic carbon-monoxide dehydrogenase large subunit